MSSSRYASRNLSSPSINAHNEPSENEFEATPNPPHFPPTRSPLNAIPVPSQLLKDFRESNHDTQGGRLFHKAGSVSAKVNTSRVTNRHGNEVGRGKEQCEVSLFQRTPPRSGSRMSLGGASGTGSRMAGNFIGGRGMGLSSSFSRVSTGLCMVRSNAELEVDVPHFELAEDPDFWKDHNVQVLIRVRPLSTVEKASHDYVRCVRQESAHTLALLGHPETRFTFDHIACETISQENLFRVAGVPMVENCMSGYNSCMFAYGQTGSGKTYTMMGELPEEDGSLNDRCGVTPRIFEYLFSRIRMEEESRRDEKLKYVCKCSFLEIYNEQITDLLEPSSTNLQLREDLKKGVYVENLRECCVSTVSDVLKFLLQGAANRKMAATHMNSESSRSHSVFTCIIESRWETDSMTHFRFARLNLVDLAGSERQKSSGAEGERLKEAANINKSLSTLGLVIMSLVDLAHGKHRHVPYRDSRLTFLLQDSLGGNSKTTIIANISPSRCSANETLSTIKFAQRAKLIQNDAKVNEDASGDITTLQQQIQQLKGQLSFILKHDHNDFSFLNQLLSCPKESGFNGLSEPHDLTKEQIATSGIGPLNERGIKLKRIESILFGALSREKMAVTALQKLETEIAHTNHYACQMEDEMHHSKMILKFREEKIKQLELVVDGLLPTEKHIEQENEALKKEIELLQARIAKNQDATRFDMDNNGMLQQFELFKNFYQQGEREKLLVEVSKLRNELLESLEENNLSQYENQDIDTVNELESCRNMNTKLIREVHQLQRELRKHFTSCLATDSFSKDSDEIRHTDECSLLYKTVDDASLQNKSRHNSGTALVLMPSNPEDHLIDSRLMTKLEDPEEIHLTKDKRLMYEQNHMQIKKLQKKGRKFAELNSDCPEVDYLKNQCEAWGKASTSDSDEIFLQSKLDKLTKDLEHANLVIHQYEADHASQLSYQHQVKQIHEEVEIETARTIVQLEEDVASLQLELQQRVCLTTQKNIDLKNTIAAKEEEIKSLCIEWERATLELTSFLADGSRSLNNVSEHIDSIASSFPRVNASSIKEHVLRVASVCIEKEKMILLLQKSLEDAQDMVLEMELKLKSLMGATLVLSEFQQPDNIESFTTGLNERSNVVEALESKLKLKEDQVIEAEKRIAAAFLVIKWLADCHPCGESRESDFSIDISGHEVSYTKLDECNLESKLISPQVEGFGILEIGNDIIASYADLEVYITSLRTEICNASSSCTKLIKDLTNEVHVTRSKFIQLQGNVTRLQPGIIKLQCLEEQEVKFGGQSHDSHVLHQIVDDLASTNEKLNTMINCMNTYASMEDCLLKDEELVDPDQWSTGSDSSSDTVGSGAKSGVSSYNCCFKLSETLPEQMYPNFRGSFQFQNVPGSEESQTLGKYPVDNDAIEFFLRKEFNTVFDTFNRLSALLTTILDNNYIDCSSTTEMMQGGFTDAGGHNTREAISDGKTNHVGGFLSKFEEAYTMIKDADDMLNALVKANNDVKQVSVGLTADRNILMGENEQLKSSISLKEEENSLLHLEINHSILDIAKSFSFLEISFLEMQKEVESMFSVLYSEVLSMGQMIIQFISNSKLLLEDTCSDIMAKGNGQFILYQCHVGKVMSKILSFKGKSGFYSSRRQEYSSILNTSQTIALTSDEDDITHSNRTCKEKRDSKQGKTLELERGISQANLIHENLLLKKELDRKEGLLEGLLFDLRLLQESASTRKDIRDKTELFVSALGQAQSEFETTTNHLDELLIKQRNVESQLIDTENALFISNSELEQAKKTLSLSSDQNAELRMLLKDLYLKKFESEGQMEEQKEVIKNLEDEILHLTSLVDEKLQYPLDGTGEDLGKIIDERDQLSNEVRSLKYKLEMAYALAEENEVIAVEARQESEASKLHAEQKVEETKILEHSIEELENTINILEKKVYEMDTDIGKHHIMRDSLEVELQALRKRLLAFEAFTDIQNTDHQSAGQTEGQIPRKLHDRLLELYEADNRIRVLETERAEQEIEIKQCKDYISELVLHSEAQASQYQEKYKILEAMFREAKTDLSIEPILDKAEQVPMRTRGSSSPFRCIATLVQQRNTEKEQEMFAAGLQIKELEALAASRQREVCLLNTRLAAAESMTHDVIRDLLSVKLDMTNYANLVDQHQVQKVLEDAHHQSAEVIAKEQELFSFRKHVDDLIEESESYISDIQRKEADILVAQMTIEQLKERNQLLSAQNEMLKVDKNNLSKKAAQLDEMVKTLLGTQRSQCQMKHTARSKETGSSTQGDANLAKRLMHSERPPSRVNHELMRDRKLSVNNPFGKNKRCGFETDDRK